MKFYPNRGLLVYSLRLGFFITPMKNLKSLLFILLISTRLFAANDIYFSKIGIEQGLSQFSVMNIYQDELGILWFGTREGVNRYNGNTVEQLRSVSDDAQTAIGILIKNICGDRNGHIYIQSQNGVIEYNMSNSSMRTVVDAPVDAIAYGSHCLWIAEGNRLFTYKNGEKQLYTEVTASKSSICIIKETADQRVFVGTFSSGVFAIDQNKKIREVIPDCSQVSAILEDNKTIWVGTWQNGLYRIDRNGNVHNYTTTTNSEGTNISSNFVRAVCVDNNGFLWIGTKKGLDKLSVENGVFEHYNSDENNSRCLSNESVWSLLKDRQGTIWVGTYFGGVDYFNPDIDFYAFHDLNNGIFRNKPFPVISDIVEAKDGSLFLCTEGNGLILYNPQTRTYRTCSADEKDKNSLSNDNIKTAYYDIERDELWLGMHLGGICKLDLKTLQISQFRQVKPDREQSDIVRSILPYGDNLIVATYNGVFIFERKTGRFSVFSEKLNDAVTYCVDLKMDSKGNFWIASRGLFYFDTKTEEVKSYFHDVENPRSLSNDNIQKIFIDSENRVWIATSGGGVNLYDEANDSFARYDSKQCGLKNDYVSNIMQSRSGYLIIATSQGFSMLDVENGKIYNYDRENGMPVNSFYNGGMCLTRKGDIFMAGMNGMVSFFEENLLMPQRNFDIHFVNLWINNRQVTAGDETGVLKRSLPYTDVIKLNYKQSTFSVEYASNNYVHANQTLYRYRLEGVSSSWNELPQPTNTLNFINLNAGDYKLIIEAVSPNNNSIVAAASLKITISPPFYRAWYAYCVYLAIVILIVWSYLVSSRSKLLLKASLEYEKKEKQHLEETNQSKLRFFTNISHEFRTPLTLINGQVDMLLQTHNIQPTIYDRILSIKRNTLNMQNLISELLEFRKSEQGHLKIKVSRRDIVKFVYEIYLSFLEYANYRQITFRFECADDAVDLWFDPVQLQKVFYNLISNAFKYTPQGGNVNILMEQGAETVSVQVFDSGIGISEEDIKKIFDRFYQAENGMQINNTALGTGIGLALTKNILEVHSATIRVDSQLQVGSRFTVMLQKGKSHFTQEQIEEIADADNACLSLWNELDTEFMQEVVHTQLAGKEPQCSMLIVEDNDELRAMLKNIFEPLYRIHTASDGEQGLGLTIELQPDIVLSDLMMPRMSGTEMCSKIKNNFSVCHIPVVLLTAQTAIEASIEGLRLGADDYITKPFNIKTLITRCNNLVNGRRLLQEKYNRQIDSSPRLVATNNMDREFLEKATRIVEENIDKSDFNINVFSREMNMGRTKLFEKLKGITGLTPNDFIMNIRMKKAAVWLLNNPEYNISDICYMAGFSSPKYFTKCFREQLGVSPSAYRKRKDEKED